MCKIGTPNFKFAGKSLPDSLYEQVLRTRGLLHIDDLNCEPVSSHPLHRRLVDRGVKSFSLFSLFFGSRHVGFFELYSHEPRALSALSGEEIKDLLPIFSLVMQRSIDEHKNSIELLLEEKCTPLHPSIVLSLPQPKHRRFPPGHPAGYLSALRSERYCFRHCP
jgi:hypothetical protein